MTNTVYANKVLEAKLNSTLNTLLDAKKFMTIDESLAENAGMTKTINVYTYTGSAEEVAEGAGNSVRGSLAFVPENYTVKVVQSVFDYTDEDEMRDPEIVNIGIEANAGVMTSDINSKFFVELAKATLEQTYPKAGKISYDTIVDAIGKMNLEDESELFVFIGADLKAVLRKDPDFKTVNAGEIIVKGQIGTISGIPVAVSKAVPAKTAFVADKKAVKLFIKKDSEVEQKRDGELRKNTVIMRRVALVALADATKLVKITEALV